PRVRANSAIVGIFSGISDQLYIRLIIVQSAGVLTCHFIITALKTDQNSTLKTALPNKNEVGYSVAGGCKWSVSAMRQKPTMTG
ncbi:hypothetical protein, partial [Collinsella aerofaciens]|uniref:hypothetical protein n=1 Tax=Collinsella aerofaciens TaxID=74426 RepID=UPI0034A52663